MSPRFDYRMLTQAAMKTIGGLYGVPLEMAVSLALMSLSSRMASVFTGRADVA